MRLVWEVLSQQGKTSNLFSRFCENLTNPKLGFYEIFPINQGNDMKNPLLHKV